MTDKEEKPEGTSVEITIPPSDGPRKLKFFVSRCGRIEFTLEAAKNADPD